MGSHKSRRRTATVLISLVAATILGAAAPAAAQETCPPFNPYVTDELFVYVCTEPHQGSPLFHLMLEHTGVAVLDVFVQPADGAVEVWIRVNEQQPTRASVDVYRAAAGGTTVLICVTVTSILSDVDRCFERFLPI